MALTIWEDFEDNDLSGWTVHNSNLTTDTTSYTGSYAAYIDVKQSTDIDLAHRVIESGGKQVEKLIFWYRETSDSHGGGVRLVDSNGSYILAVGTDNPQPWASDSSSITRYSPGANYSTWYKIEITFDWASGQYTFNWNNGGLNKTLNLNNSSDLETVELVNANAPHNSSGINDLDGVDGYSDCNMWWDYFRYDPGVQKYGEIKIKTVNGIQNLPVYNLGTSGNNVHEMLRVQTDSGTGFIPLTDTSDATYNYLRVQTQNHGVLAVHNATALTGIVNQVTTDVTLNNQTIYLIVYEDTNGDGTAENTETITVGDGTNTYNLSSLDGSSENTYWIEWQLNNSDVTKTAKANYADLENVGRWDSSSEWDNAQSETGVVHESASNTDHNDSTIVKQGYSVQNPLYSSNLVGYWPLQEDSGSTAYDFSGANNDASVSGASQGSVGILGNSSYNLGSSDDLVDGGASIGSVGSDETWSIAFWAYPSPHSSRADVITWESSSDGIEGQVRFNNNGNNEFNATFRDDGGSYSNISTDGATTGAWNFIVVVSDGSYLRIYLNSSESANISHPDNSNRFDTGFLIGGNTRTGSYYDGKITEVRAYNDALSSSEIQSLYNVVSNQGNLVSDVKTSSTILIDDFESGDLSKYSTTGSASITSSTVFEGSYALQIDNVMGEPDYAYSTSGLDNYPSAGDTFEFRFYLTNSSDDNVDFYFGTQSDTPDANGYKLRMRSYQGDILLEDNSTGSNLDSTNVSYSSGKWYRVEVDWGSNGSITVTLYDETDSQVSQISAANSAYTSGGIEFSAATGSGNSSTMYFDNVKITN